MPISLDHSDWTHLIGLAYLNPILWNNLGEPVYMDPSNHGVRKVYHGVPHSDRKVPHSVMKVPHSVRKVPHSVRKVPSQF